MENVIDIAKLKIEELVNLNNNKRNYLKKLYEITKLQTIDISSNSLNSLLDHIKQKQDIMNAIDDIDKRIDRENQRLITIEQRYWKQFTAMEQAMSQMNSQSSWLSQQFGGQ